MRITPRNFILVFAGGAVGAAMRWGTGVAGESLGFGILASVVIVNVVGAFLLGWFMIGERPDSHHMNGLFAIGMLGSFTTFSTYAVATVELLESGDVVKAFVFGLGSIVVGLGAAVAGRYLGARP